MFQIARSRSMSCKVCVRGNDTMGEGNDEGTCQVHGTPGKPLEQRPGKEGCDDPGQCCYHRCKIWVDGGFCQLYKQNRD